MNPIAELAAVVREVAPDALILVDSVSGLGAVPFEMDAWGVDVVVTGSQKAWMAAPGPGHDRRLGAGLGRDGDRDRCRASTSTCGPIARATPPGQTPWTPAIAVVYQVDEGIRLMTAEGAEQRLRPPRGVRRRDAGRPDRPRLRAVRRPALRLEDGDRARSSRTTSTGRRSTASSSAAASSWPAARAS